MKCYFCENEGVTDEHIPPQCFFPKEKRKNLITVKSCKIHNNIKSGDDEYLRNVISSCMNINHEGEKQLRNKTIKSIFRNQSGKNNLINNPQPIKISGEDSISIVVDYRRINKTLSLMSSAFYFYIYKLKYNERWITILSEITNPDDQLYPFYCIIKEIENSNTPFLKEQKVENPDIFKYYSCLEEKVVLFKYIFYGGVNIYCFSKRK